MASLTLRTETAGLRPEFEYVEDISIRAVRDPIAAGAVHRRSIEPISRRRFSLTWLEAGFGQRRLLLDAYTDSERGVRLMNYTPVGDVDANAVEVAFMQPPIIAEVSIDVYAMEAVVEEVL